MASTIDPAGIDATQPPRVRAETAPLRANFAAIKAQLGNAAADIDALQAGKLDLSATSAFGRSLIDDADAAAARTTMGALATNGDGSSVKVTATDADTARSMAARAADRYHARDFGIVADGTDQAARINAAIAAIGARGGGDLHFDGAEYCIASTVSIGNGSPSAFSTINGVRLVGVGGSYVRLNVGYPLAVGTRFKWVGPSGGGPMIDIKGPCTGNSIDSIALNAAGLANICLRLVSASRGRFPRVTCASFRQRGLILTNVGAEAIGGEPIGGTTGNAFSDFQATGVDAGVAGTICIDLDGYPGSAVNGWDPCRNTFRNTYLVVTRDGGTGIRLGLADQNVFADTYMTGAGTPDGTAASLRFVETRTAPSNYAFPQNNHFTGHLDIGQNIPVAVSGDIGPGNTLPLLTQLDRQVLPRWPETTALRFEVFEPGTWPKGGWWSAGGLNRLECGVRNKLVNATFHRATRGTSFSSPASLTAMLLDLWRLYYTGSPAFTVTREEFALGQSDVPHEPRYFLRIAITGGASAMNLLQRVADVATLEGRRTCLSAWMRVSSGAATVSGRVDRSYGTGGSPSANDAAVAGNTETLTAEWGHYEFPITLPAASGARGTNGNDYVSPALTFGFSGACTIDIAMPQWEAGTHATAFDLRPVEIDDAICERSIRKVGAGAYGVFFSAASAAFGIPLAPPMRAAPSVSADGSTITVARPNSGPDLTGTGIVSAISPSSARHVFVSVGGLSGASGGNTAVLTTAFIIADAAL